jgi:hypothetical protein
VSIHGLLLLVRLWLRHVPIRPIAGKLQRVARPTVPSLVKHGQIKRIRRSQTLLAALALRQLLHSTSTVRITAQ